MGDIRPVMIHAQLVRREQLSGLAKLGVIPPSSPPMSGTGGRAVENFGASRAAHQPPPLGAGAGHPLYPASGYAIGPEYAGNRVVRRKPRYPQRRGSGTGAVISPLEALKAVTKNAAHQYFKEDELGSIARQAGRLGHSGRRPHGGGADADPGGIRF